MKTPAPATGMSETIWTAHAPVYERVWERSTTLWGRDALVLGQLPPVDSAGPAPRFLDIACGTGAFAIAAAAMGYEVTATDYSPGMVAHVDAKIASSNLQNKMKASVVDGHTLEGLADASFEVVSSIFGIFMFPDRAAAWRSAQRVLVPGGRLIVTSWDPSSANLSMFRYIIEHAVTKPDAVATDKPPHKPNPTLVAASFRADLEDAGFKNVRVHTVSHSMCFQSGEELTEAMYDHAGLRAMGGDIDEASFKNSVLDFVQLVVDGKDPFGDDGKAFAAAAIPGAPVESHPLWDQPFAIPCRGHVAIATNPSP